MILYSNRGSPQHITVFNKFNIDVTLNVQMAVEYPVTQQYAPSVQNNIGHIVVYSTAISATAPFARSSEGDLAFNAPQAPPFLGVNKGIHQGTVPGIVTQGKDLGLIWAPQTVNKISALKAYTYDFYPDLKVDPATSPEDLRPCLDEAKVELGPFRFLSFNPAANTATGVEVWGRVSLHVYAPSQPPFPPTTAWSLPIPFNAFNLPPRPVTPRFVPR